MRTPAFVAEVSANHLGKYERALALVEAAAAAGASAVKFQTYDPDRLVGNHNVVIEDGPWAGQKMIDLYRRAATPREWLPDLFEVARRLGMVPFSSPFAREDVDFLEDLGAELYKIASFEIVDLDLIARVGETQKPIVISTGMASLDEIERAVDVASEAGATAITLLRCTSAYPTPIEDANLASIRTLADYFSHDPLISIGLSDHTLGTVAGVAAIALGAVMVEKHLTLLRSDGGPDAGFSAEPAEFAELVRVGRLTARALGRSEVEPTELEVPQKQLRRALWVVADVREGEAFTRANLRSCRPSFGKPCLPIEVWLGSYAARDVDAGTMFEPSLAKGEPPG